MSSPISPLPWLLRDLVPRARAVIECRPDGREKQREHRHWAHRDEVTPAGQRREVSVTRRIDICEHGVLLAYVIEDGIDLTCLVHQELADAFPGV